MATKKKATVVAAKSKVGKFSIRKSTPKKNDRLKSVSPKAKPAAKKAPTKKTTPVKTATAKSKKAAKQAPSKKAVSKLTNKKPSETKKTTPGKKTAKAVSKITPPIKSKEKKSVVNTKKNTQKKEKALEKKKAPEKKTKETTAINQKPSSKVLLKDNADKHKAELKKAIAKVKKKEKEEKKSRKEFIIPKTNTEKARKYEPEFTKSVLDQTPPENSGPTMRYSDSELQEFKELITRKLETAKKELGYLQGLITRKDQLGGDESDNRYMTMEDGSLSMEREQLSQMASRQITFIDHLEKAMMRIENKTYGICRVTGKLIDKARLRAVPHATLSIEAKMGSAK
jgi:RNA polymerase-binding transcription factor DksA